MNSITKSSPLDSPATNRPCRVLVLVGPTASGKTAVSLLVAPRIDAEILSADSRQVYRYMNIGTAKPTPEQRKVAKHHFVDELLPDRDFNAGEFGMEGRRIIEDIFRRRKVPFVVGGSGLYVRGLIDGFFDGPGADDAIRENLERRLRTEGAEKLLEELREVDPDSASRMLPGNKKRIVRALEVYALTGNPLSELHKKKIDITFDPVLVGLRWERKKLYQRIDDRVDRMIADGLVKEVEWLRDNGYTPKLNALLTTGYVEVFRHFEREFSARQMIDLIKRNTRRYAKRQLTWFRYDNRIRWFDLQSEDDFPAVATAIVDHFLHTGNA